MRQAVRVRFDPGARPASQAKLLRELHAFDAAESAIAPLRSHATVLAGNLDAALSDAGRAASRLRMFFSGPGRRDQARHALADLDSLMRSPSLAAVQARLADAQAAMGRPSVGEPCLWHDYEQRAIA